LLNNYKNAEIIITHGGVGSIMVGLRLKKKILVLPRLEKFGEALNNHQQQIVSELNRLGYIQAIDESTDINQQINNLRRLPLTPYPFNNNELLKSIEKIIK